MKKQKLKRAQYTPPQTEITAIFETAVICASATITDPTRDDDENL